MPDGVKPEFLSQPRACLQQALLFARGHRHRDGRCHVGLGGGLPVCAMGQRKERPQILGDQGHVPPSPGPALIRQLKQEFLVENTATGKTTRRDTCENPPGTGTLEGGAGISPCSLDGQRGTEWGHGESRRPGLCTAPESEQIRSSVPSGQQRTGLRCGGAGEGLCCQLGGRGSTGHQPAWGHGRAESLTWRGHSPAFFTHLGPDPDGVLLGGPVPFLQGCAAPVPLRCHP